MADKKITALTAATTADGTEPLPIVQSGETKKATGKVVVSGAVSDLAQTWNAAGTTFTGLKLNVTDTASASGSLLLDVQKGGTSQLVLDKSGNLGLGTDAPVGVMDVRNATGSNSFLVQGNSTSDGTIALSRITTTAINGSVGRLSFRAFAEVPGSLVTGASIRGVSEGSWSSTSYPTRITFETVASGSTTLTERMRLDSSGNLGLGVTPSAWSGAALQLQTGAALYGFSNTTNIIQNAYYDGSWKYISTAGAALAQIAQGTHYWFTAPSGTAGNAISFIQRVSASETAFVINDIGVDYDTRIEGDTDANLFFVDASTDRVGIGTNAPGAKLHVFSPNNISALRIANITSGSGLVLSSWNSDSPWFRLYDAAGGETIRFASNSSSYILSGNFGLGTDTFGTSAAGVFAVKNGTAPTTGPADTIQIYSSDVSAGNTTLSIYTEGTPVSDSTDNAVTKKIAVRINGTLYYLLADTDNS